MELINLLKFLLGLFLGANLSLFLYACIIAGKEEDKHLTKGGKR